MSSTSVTSALRNDAYGVAASRRVAVVAGTFAQMSWHVNAGVTTAAEATRLAVATKPNQISVPRSSPPA